MKKIKFFAMLIAAAMMSISFTACSDDDDNSGSISNTERYQQEVDATVKAQKQNTKAILLVAFGSTWQQAYDAFDHTVSEYKEEFPGYDVHIDPLSLSVACHIGPGALALACCKKITL